MVIYITENIVNNKKYIGKDKNNKPEYLGSGILLRSAIKKYGKNNFKKEILFECNDENLLNEMEKYYIKFFDAVNSENYYNIHEGGIGGNTGNYSDDHRKKISEANKGKTKNIKVDIKTIEKRKISLKKTIESGKYVPWNKGLKGRKLSEETKKKISEKAKGRKVKIVDKNKFIKSVETRRKNNKYILSEDTKRKISESHKGKSMSIDTKLKLSEIHKNRKITWSHKIGEKLRNKEKSSEHKKKLSEKCKNMRWVTNIKKKEIKRIDKEKLEEYLNNGWVRGRQKI